MSISGAKSPAVTAASDAISLPGYVYMVVSALEYSSTPLLTSAYVSSEADKKTYVAAIEVAKAVVSMLMYRLEEPDINMSPWDLKSSLEMAALPAAMFTVQNICYQHAYQNLDGLTFNLLNQTKILFTAFFVRILLGQKLAPNQYLALGMLLGAGVIATLPSRESKEEKEEKEETKEVADDADSKAEEKAALDKAWKGAAPLIFASALSGLNSAISQRAMQGKAPRSPYVYSTELSVYSLSVLSMNWLATNTGPSLKGFTPKTSIPILANAFGGILVGLVVKHAGGVRKGYVTMAGMVLTAVWQWYLFGKPIRRELQVALVLMLASLNLYNRK
eukprot:gene15245-18030_t